MSAPDKPRLDRREAIQWMLAAAATTILFDRGAGGASVPAPEAGAKGYGTDSDLLKDYKPGDIWPLTFSPEQRRCATALCDVIIPADSKSPSASAVGVPDFIDEWISAPYPAQREDRAVIVAGLGWIDAEAQKRFALDFAGLIHSQQTAICDDIHNEPEAETAFKTAARFFQRFRELAAGGFYTSKVGMMDLQYVGNVPLSSFDGPPPEVLRKLGLLQPPAFPTPP